MTNQNKIKTMKAIVMPSGEVVVKHDDFTVQDLEKVSAKLAEFIHFGLKKEKKGKENETYTA